jgi:hypothetical protein
MFYYASLIKPLYLTFDEILWSMPLIYCNWWNTEWLLLRFTVGFVISMMSVNTACYMSMFALLCVVFAEIVCLSFHTGLVMLLSCYRLILVKISVSVSLLKLYKIVNNLPYYYHNYYYYYCLPYCLLCKCYGRTLYNMHCLTHADFPLELMSPMVVVIWKFPFNHRLLLTSWLVKLVRANLI